MTELRPHLDWMLKDLVDSVPGTRHVLVLTADGLRMAQHSISDDAADRLAAACAGLQSLSSAVASTFPSGDRRMRLVVIEAGGGFFYLMAAGSGAYLAVIADEGVDAGLMGQQMRDLVDRIGEHLSAPPRVPDGSRFGTAADLPADLPPGLTPDPAADRSAGRPARAEAVSG